MSDTELEIVSVLEDARITAMCEQRAETLERLLSDDLVYTHSSGSVDTKASFLDSVRNGPVQYRTVERSEDVVRLVGDTALFSGRAAIHLEFDGHPVDLDLRYLAVWVQHDGAWRFEAWHSTPVTH
ncbi:MAG: nuclear transport factor 2 family protein [Actinomycetota bacterium]